MCGSTLNPASVAASACAARETLTAAAVRRRSTCRAASRRRQPPGSARAVGRVEPGRDAVESRRIAGRRVAARARGRGRGGGCHAHRRRVRRAHGQGTRRRYQPPRSSPRSANRLAERVTSGVESLEYELTLDGVTREMMPDHQNGTYRVKQVIDHDTAGRYLVATYDPDGRLLSSILQDPGDQSAGRLAFARGCSVPLRVHAAAGHLTLSPPEMERLHMQASVAMMQASGNQQLQIVEGPSGRQYRIEVPHVSAETSGAVWDLDGSAGRHRRRATTTSSSSR